MLTGLTSSDEPGGHAPSNNLRVGGVFVIAVELLDGLGSEVSRYSYRTLGGQLLDPLGRDQLDLVDVGLGLSPVDRLVLQRPAVAGCYGVAFSMNVTSKPLGQKILRTQSSSPTQVSPCTASPF